MIEIRPATRADTQTTFDIRRAAIHAQCMGVYSREDLLAWTQGGPEPWYADLVERHFHVACLHGEVVATIMLGPQVGELGALFVAPHAMGQGIGRRLVEHLEDLARAAGWSHLSLEATLNAAAFYRRCGFIGDSEAVYHSPSGVSLRCVPMHKVLQPA
ncbi:GNAT family N-acetyltransferase [Pseudomonas sp.]|uniref:GNAT family N-acetyltransferase n=1 Tax=Pseudomonas sp. TaxID=306 RepID=UPI0028B0DA2B|nr:GNAT family N-acetyltransferase [Pseudomonas sp.]